MAAQAGHVEAVRVLVQFGANVNRGDMKGVSPLLCAISGDSSGEAVKILVGASADVNRADANGVTPLCQAAFHGNLAITNTLLENGAKPDR